MPIPVAVFAHRRAGHLAACLAALRRNHGADNAAVTVFCDGARSAAEAAAVAEVRRTARAAAGDGGFHAVEVIERERNLGLAGSITGGVSDMLARHDRVVVVEDDIVAGEWFLRYCSDSLETYAGDPAVASAHGYSYPVRLRLPETFFMRGADCWGWATWRRAWSAFRSDSRALLAELDARDARKEFDLDGSLAYTAMLEDHACGRRDTWAARWHASTWLAGMHTLFPGRSLVANRGNDGTGDNCGSDDVYAVTPTTKPVVVRRQPVVEDRAARDAFIDFHKRLRSPWRRLRRRAARALGISR